MLPLDVDSEGWEDLDYMSNKVHDRNHYYNSKEGRLADAEAAAEATGGGSVRG